MGSVNVSPFVNLAYINFKNDAFSENGDISALKANKQQLNATISTLGFRVNTEREISDNLHLKFHSELGWQHNFGKQEGNLKLALHGNAPTFTVDSSPSATNGVIVKASAAVTINDRASLSFGYNGILSQKYQDNSISTILRYDF